MENKQSKFIEKWFSNNFYVCQPTFESDKKNMDLFYDKIKSRKITEEGQKILKGI